MYSYQCFIEICSKLLKRSIAYSLKYQIYNKTALLTLVCYFQIHMYAKCAYYVKKRNTSLSHPFKQLLKINSKTNLHF